MQERLRIENRIEALLFTLGVRKRPSLRSWDRDLAVLRTGDGREMPNHLRAELDRLRRRLVMTLELIREVEIERDEAAEAKPQEQACRKIAALCRIRGLGDNFAAVLTREVFYRSFDNRRQIASYVSITPALYQSGGMDRDRRLDGKVDRGLGGRQCPIPPSTIAEANSNRPNGEDLLRRLEPLGVGDRLMPAKQSGVSSAYLTRKSLGTEKGTPACSQAITP